MKLPLLLPFLLSQLFASINGHKKLSSIAVNVSVCPPEIFQAVLGDIAAQRRAEHLRPLTTTPEMMASAKQWANARGAGVNYKPGYGTAGEYTTSVADYPMSKRTINLASTDLFNEWKTTALRRRPWYMGEGGSGRRYTQEEWAQTAHFGVGCGTWAELRANGRHRVIFWLTLHFRYPQEMSTAKIGSNVCPDSLVKSVAAGFNERRSKKGLKALKVTSEMTRSAAKVAAAHQPRWKEPNFELAGQYVLHKVQPASHGGPTHFDLRGLDIFAGSRLNSADGAPWYTGDTADGRYFTSDEWQRTTEMGVGCAAYRRTSGSNKRFLMVVHFKFPPYIIV